MDLSGHTSNGNGAREQGVALEPLPSASPTLEQRVEQLERERDQFIAALRQLAGFLSKDNPMSKMIMMSMPKDFRKQIEALQIGQTSGK
jgi:hypothetical protein